MADAVRDVRFLLVIGDQRDHFGLRKYRAHAGDLDVLRGPEAYGTTVNDIARYNGIVETDVIYPGQRLRIFVPEESTPKWYVVRPGDTLTKIAEKFGTTVQRLMWLNDISDPNLIYPRQRLRIRP